MGKFILFSNYNAALSHYESQIDHSRHGSTTAFVSSQASVGSVNCKENQKRKVKRRDTVKSRINSKDISWKYNEIAVFNYVR